MYGNDEGVVYALDLTTMKWNCLNTVEYKRYGHAVTNVGRLSSQDLLRLQNEGFVSIYSKYWRWWSVIRRWGLIGLLLTFYRMLIMVIGKARHKYKVSSIHPSLR